MRFFYVFLFLKQSFVSDGFVQYRAKGNVFLHDEISVTQKIYKNLRKSAMKFFLTSQKNGQWNNSLAQANWRERHLLDRMIKLEKIKAWKHDGDENAQALSRH